MKSCYGYLCQMAGERPQKTAVVHHDRRISYRQLKENVDRLAGALEKQGVGRGSVVALAMRNSISMVECIFSLWKLGAAAAPVNFRENPAGMKQMTDICRAKLVIGEERYITPLAALSEGVRFIADVPCPGMSDLESLKKTGRPSKIELAEPEDELLYVFTSGTTGVPKAAVHTSAALAEFTLRCYERGGLYDSGDIFLSYSPLCHIGGLRIMLGNLMCGATLVLADSFDPAEVARLIHKEQVSQMFIIPPSMVTRLKDSKDICRDMLSSVKRIRISGGLCTRQAADTLFEFFGDVTLINGYGSSESAISTFNVFGWDEYAANGDIVKSVGKPLPGCEICLMDDEGREISTFGQEGNALGRCAYKFSRYQTLEGSEYPAEWFDIGDRLLRDQRGNYYFRGRRKDIIKSGGENVHAGDVEAAIMCHEAVAECAVFKTPHDILGEAVSAAVVLREGYSCTGREIFDFCRESIASYKKPLRIFFVSQLPKTASGKVRKFILEEKAKNGFKEDIHEIHR